MPREHGLGQYDKLITEWLMESERLSDVYERYQDLLDLTDCTWTRDTFRRHVRNLASRGTGGYKEKKNAIQIEEQVNQLVVTTSREQSRIKSLDDLIDFCNIDTEEWAVERHVVNPWEVTMKVKRRDEPCGTYWHEVVQQTNFQVKAWFTKRHPDTVVMPELKRIEFEPLRVTDFPDRPKTGLQTALILGDSQMAYLRDMFQNTLTPFHDRAVLSIFLQMVHDLKPSLIVFLGDMLDLPDWSDKFVQSQECWWTLQPALLELGWFFAKVRALVPDASIYYLEGNHEQRLPKHVLKYQAQAYNLHRIDNLTGHEVLSIPNLLALENHGIEWVGNYPDGHIWLNPALRVSHGTKAVEKMIRDATYSEIIGHTHHALNLNKTIHANEGERIVSITGIGCSCRRDAIVPANGDRVNWQPSIGVVDYDPEGSDFEISNPVVRGDRLVFGGRVYEGNDYGALLWEETRGQVDFFRPGGSE